MSQILVGSLVTGMRLLLFSKPMGHLTQMGAVTPQATAGADDVKLTSHHGLIIVRRVKGRLYKHTTPKMSSC